MFEVEKIFSFEAGHELPDHGGKCAYPHGHSYVVHVCVRAETLSEEGMVVDFSDISSVVQPMIETYFDHKWLNDSLNMKNTTAENIAHWIYSYVKPKLRGLYKVRVYETARCCASYYE